MHRIDAAVVRDGEHGVVGGGSPRSGVDKDLDGFRHDRVWGGQLEHVVHVLGTERALQAVKGQAAVVLGCRLYQSGGVWDAGDVGRNKG